jgi:hypothetical protein
MAFLVTKTDSPFLQIRTRDAGGKWHQRSTVLRKENRLDRRRAKSLVEEESLKERAWRNVSETEMFASWVMPFLRNRYSAAHQARTLERYLASWRNLSIYLERHGLRHPRQLKYAHVQEFHRWRQQPDDDRVRAGCHNTALADLKLLGLILDEAIRLEYCDRNCCRKTGLQKRPAKQKPEITDADAAMILGELKQEPAWMSVSFQIAIAHGTRLRATSIDLRRDVNWEKWTVTFFEKAGKIFTVPLAEQLRPLFERLRAEGCERTCILPKDASKHWRRFFNRIGRPAYCFHCCRVSVITKMARAGVGQSQAMKYVGHSSVEIHRQYQRLHCEDLGDCAEALKPAITLPADFTLPVWDSDDECDGAELVRM